VTFIIGCSFSFEEVEDSIHYSVDNICYSLAVHAQLSSPSSSYRGGEECPHVQHLYPLSLRWSVQVYSSPPPHRNSISSCSMRSMSSQWKYGRVYAASYFTRCDPSSGAHFQIPSCTRQPRAYRRPCEHIVDIDMLLIIRCAALHLISLSSSDVHVCVSLGCYRYRRHFPARLWRGGYHTSA
jgi:hypothetical protein